MSIQISNINQADGIINFGEQPYNNRNSGKGGRKKKMKDDDEADGRAVQQNIWHGDQQQEKRQKRNAWVDEDAMSIQMSYTNQSEQSLNFALMANNIGGGKWGSTAKNRIPQNQKETANTHGQYFSKPKANFKKDNNGPNRRQIDDAMSVNASE